MANSTAFLVLNLFDYFSESDRKKMLIILGIIAVAQISLFLVFKLVFFDIVYEWSVSE